MYFSRFCMFVMIFLLFHSGVSVNSQEVILKKYHLSSKVMTGLGQADVESKIVEERFVSDLLTNYFPDGELRMLDIGNGRNHYLNKMLAVLQPTNSRFQVEIESAFGVDIDDAFRRYFTQDKRFYFLNGDIEQVVEMMEAQLSAEEVKERKLSKVLYEQVRSSQKQLEKKFNVVTIIGDMVQLLNKLPAVDETLIDERSLIVISPYGPNWTYEHKKINGEKERLNILSYLKPLVDKGYEIEIYGDGNSSLDKVSIASKLLELFPENFSYKFIRGFPSVFRGGVNYFIVLKREGVDNKEASQASLAGVSALRSV